jgi:hypothetical protein
MAAVLSTSLYSGGGGRDERYRGLHRAKSAGKAVNSRGDREFLWDPEIAVVRASYERAAENDGRSLRDNS